MTAARRLQPVVAEDDPLWQKFLAAPLDPEPAPEQERLGLAEAKAGVPFLVPSEVPSG